MEYAPDGWVDLQPGMPAQIQSGLLRLGELEVSLDTADMWEPCPDWERLRPKAGRILSKLDQVLARLNLWTLGGTLLVLLQDPSQVDSSWADIIHARARGAAEAMWAGWRGDDVQLGAGAGQLGGLGSGLTPAGDDFMLGTMLCAWLAHPAPKRYCGTVLDACASRTTILSRAFLRSTAAGECSAPWHRLLEALEGGSGKQLDTATQEVLSSGHTSGADALAGFLWMGLRVLEN
jgi:hypothetical protein